MTWPPLTNGALQSKNCTCVCAGYDQRGMLWSASAAGASTSHRDKLALTCLSGLARSFKPALISSMPCGAGRLGRSSQGAQQKTHNAN